MMAALRHPNVLSFIGLCMSPPCLISEYCARGSLYDMLRKARGSPQPKAALSWPLRLKVVSWDSLGVCVI